MNHEGPPLETLLRRIAETPAEFLEPPRCGNRGSVHVDAVLADLVRRLGGIPDTDQLEPFRVPTANARDQLSVALLLAWLLADDGFRPAPGIRATVLPAVAAASGELASATASVLVEDPDRREELARLTLARLDLRPAGETVAQAQDRLSSISAAERARVMEAARKAEERVREIREALARKAAAESADKYTRE